MSHYFPASFNNASYTYSDLKPLHPSSSSSIPLEHHYTSLCLPLLSLYLQLKDGTHIEQSYAKPKTKKNKKTHTGRYMDQCGWG